MAQFKIYIDWREKIEDRRGEMRPRATDAEPKQERRWRRVRGGEWRR